ncbi:MAG: IS66 family transposase [Ktedonobacterales bacterium]
MNQEARLAELEAENAVLREQVRELPLLREQVVWLAGRVQELEARLAKDSHNSSKPPSSDGLARKTKSLRRRSGKKPGGQIGHRGDTLRLVATPDAVVAHRPTTCMSCQCVLPLEAAVVVRERRQVHELPPVRLVVTEHQALQVRCPSCQAVTAAAFPAEVPSRVQYGPRLRALAVYLVEQQLVPYGRVREVFADLLGAALSVGTVVDWVSQAATALEPVEAAIKAALSQAAVLHSDETGVRQAGRLAWAHVASTQRLTHFGLHPKRGAAATTAIGILPRFRGVSVHDGWKPYRAHTACRHALCNIHHLRELTFLEEQYHQPWAKELKDLLRQMKAATDQARAVGAPQLLPAERDRFVARYEALLAMGLAANPPPPRPAHQKGRQKQSPARNLLERLFMDQDAVLAFLGDLTVPFDNNQAERDLRMLKVQQKVSGCFRSDAGGTAFVRIRGYLSSLSKQGIKRLAALESLFTGQLLYPSFG